MNFDHPNKNHELTLFSFLKKNIYKVKHSSLYLNDHLHISSLIKLKKVKLLRIFTKLNS